MVSIEEFDDTPSCHTPSQERLRDAEDIEIIISQLKRPTAKMQVESLVKKIRKEASALKALEATSTNAESVTPKTEEDTSPATSSTPAPVAASKPIYTGAPVNSLVYNSIDRFAFDAGTSSDKFVTVYLPLAGVGTIPNKKEQISCEFGNDSFDVSVLNLNGKNYRLKRDNLEHDIVPGKSKYIVKADKIVLKLHKIKGEYGSFDFWSKLTDAKRKLKSQKGADPSAGLMDMMKDMYNSGDDNMRKIIGESMLKQRTGELNNNKPSGLGGFGSD